MKKNTTTASILKPDGFEDGVITMKIDNWLLLVFVQALITLQTVMGNYLENITSKMSNYHEKRHCGKKAIK